MIPIQGWRNGPKNISLALCAEYCATPLATQLAKSLDVRSLMDIMGWKVVAMAAWYIHSNEDTKRAAMAALEKTLLPQEKGKVLSFQNHRSA